MTSINFYVSKQEGEHFRLAIAYRLVSIALQHNMSIHIHTDNEETSKKIDDLLWDKDKTSFIPHATITNDDINPFTQVSISHNHEPMKSCDYLINLSNQRPDFFSRFLKVAEIIDISEDILTAGRKRYAFYRDRGYTLEYHQL